MRKFTRKPNKQNLPKEELVLMPEEYRVPEVSKEDLYRQDFLFWKSWQDELIGALILSGMNHKKQISCAQEAIKNLQQIRILLKEEKQKQLDTYIAQLKDLKDSIVRDVYGSKVVNHRMAAERLKRNILKDFSYNKLKDSLI